MKWIYQFMDAFESSSLSILHLRNHRLDLNPNLKDWFALILLMELNGDVFYKLIALVCNTFIQRAQFIPFNASIFEQ